MKLNKKTVGITCAFILTFAVGAGVGSSGDDTKTATAAPVVKTETVSVTPKSCLDAIKSGDRLIDASGEMLNLAGQSLGLVPDLLDAVTSLDVDKVEKVNGKMQKNLNKMEAVGGANGEKGVAMRSDWDTKKAACSNDSGKSA
jgi:hypothetical protein